MKKFAFFLALVLALTPVLCSCTGGKLKTENMPDGLEIDTPTLATELETDADTYYEKEYPLVASVPQDGIYIYDVNKPGSYGVLVRYGDTVTWFGWQYLSGTDFPKVYCSDYDEDGEKEIAVALVVNKGETNHNEDLHILKVIDGKLSDIPYSNTVIANDGGINIIYNEKEGKKGVYTLSSPTNSMETDLSGEKKLQTLYFTARQELELGETITVKIGVGFVFEGVQLPQYRGISSVADVRFNGSSCILENIRLERDDSAATQQSEAITETLTETPSETNTENK